MDYSDPEGGKAAVALVRHQSVYPPNHEKYKGPILFNPGEPFPYLQEISFDSAFRIGGPGGSGVALVLLASSSLRRIIGDEFDFIGFDPRGIYV